MAGSEAGRLAGWLAGRQVGWSGGWLVGWPVDSCLVQFSSAPLVLKTCFHILLSIPKHLPPPQTSQLLPQAPSPIHHPPSSIPKCWPWSLSWASFGCAWLLLLLRLGHSILPLRSGPDPWLPRGARCTRSTRPSGHRCSPLDTAQRTVARTCGWPTRAPVALPAPTPLAEACSHMTWMGKTSPGRVLIP